MSETVAEFMNKPVKAYRCGRDARKAKKTLMQAFTASDQKNTLREEALFEGILDAVMQTKKGQETMKALAGFGYSYAFEKGNFGGFCDPVNKKIVINPSFSFEYMLQTAVHEGRHAIQYSLESDKAPNYENTQVASFLRKHRAIEADAVAHEMAFVYECKDVLPKVYQDAKEQDLPMFRAYVGEMEASGDERRAMQACFASWYECDYYRDYYDKNHKDAIKQICDWSKQEKTSGCFSEEYPAADVLKMCRYKGQSYMTEEFLNTGRAFSITQKDKREIYAMVCNYAKAVPETKTDMSVLTMRERKENGELLPARDAAQTAVVAAKLNRKGR